MPSLAWAPACPTEPGNWKLASATVCGCCQALAEPQFPLPLQVNLALLQGTAGSLGSDCASFVISTNVFKENWHLDNNEFSYLIIALYVFPLTMV